MISELIVFDTYFVDWFCGELNSTNSTRRHHCPFWRKEDYFNSVSLFWWTHSLIAFGISFSIDMYNEIISLHFGSAIKVLRLNFFDIFFMYLSISMVAFCRSISHMYCGMLTWTRMCISHELTSQIQFTTYRIPHEIRPFLPHHCSFRKLAKWQKGVVIWPVLLRQTEKLLLK